MLLSLKCCIAFKLPRKSGKKRIDAVPPHGNGVCVNFGISWWYDMYLSARHGPLMIVLHGWEDHNGYIYIYQLQLIIIIIGCFQHNLTKLV